MILYHALASASWLGLEGLTIGNPAEAVGVSKSGLFAPCRPSLASSIFLFSAIRS